MPEHAEPTIEKSAITRRFIACAQSTGRVGKSTLAEGLISWLRYAGVEFAAVDADSQHQTLSRRFQSMWKPSMQPRHSTTLRAWFRRYPTCR